MSRAGSTNPFQPGITASPAHARSSTRAALSGPGVDLAALAPTPQRSVALALLEDVARRERAVHASSSALAAQQRNAAAAAAAVEGDDTHPSMARIGPPLPSHPAMSPLSITYGDVGAVGDGKALRPVAPGDALNAALILAERSRFGVPASVYDPHGNPFTAERGATYNGPVVGVNTPPSAPVPSYVAVGLLYDVSGPRSRLSPGGGY